MTTINEPKAMAEIREIRKKLSEELNGMTHDERIAHIKKGAKNLEKEFGLKLKRHKRDTAKQGKERIVSGIYKSVGPKGGNEVTAVAANRFPPGQKPGKVLVLTDSTKHKAR